MAFPTGWTRSCKLTIQHGQVPADQTAFPVLLTAACLPNEMVTAGGANAAQSDGGDIRFSSDSGGTNQLACEIVKWTQNATPANAVAEIWVPVNILTATNVDIYVWYKAGGGLSQPAAGAAFGSQAVWDSSFKVVHHYADGTTLSLADSTVNANNGTNNSSVSAVAGKVGPGGAGFSGSNWTNKTDNTSLRPSVITLSFWLKTSQTGNTVVMEKDTNNGFSVQVATNISLGLKMNVNGPSNAIGINTTHYNPDGAWHHFGFIFGSSSTSALNHALIDGVEHSDTNNCNNPAYGSGDFDVGGRGSFAGTVMQLDEIRLSNSTRGVNWITTEYNNQNAPTSFIVVGTPGTGGGGGGSALIAAIANSYRQRRT